VLLVYMLRQQLLIVGLLGPPFSVCWSCISPTSRSLHVGIRGYLIVPILNQLLPSRLHEQEDSRKNLASSEASSPGAVTWGAMRLHRTLDSALSGGFTGSVLNTWRRSFIPVLQLRVRLGSRIASRWNAWHTYWDDVRLRLLHSRTVSLQRVRCPTHKIHIPKIFCSFISTPTTYCFSVR
jgi:hypothetical protein